MAGSTTVFPCTIAIELASAPEAQPGRPHPQRVGAVGLRRSSIAPCLFRVNTNLGKRTNGFRVCEEISLSPTVSSGLPAARQISPAHGSPAPGLAGRRSQEPAQPGRCRAQYLAQNSRAWNRRIAEPISGDRRPWNPLPGPCRVTGSSRSLPHRYLERIRNSSETITGKCRPGTAASSAVDVPNWRDPSRVPGTRPRETAAELTSSGPKCPDTLGATSDHEPATVAALSTLIVYRRPDRVAVSPSAALCRPKPHRRAADDGQARTYARPPSATASIPAESA